MTDSVARLLELFREPAIVGVGASLEATELRLYSTWRKGEAVAVRSGDLSPDVSLRRPALGEFWGLIGLRVASRAFGGG